MDIVLLIESLGSGGAERQLCTLAVEFKRRGHRVLVATYSPGDFFLPMLESGGIEHRVLPGNGRLGWAYNIRKFLRSRNPDVVLAFLEGPSLYAEIASVPSRTWGLVISERIAVPNTRSFKSRIRKTAHRLADYVTTNSHSNRLILENTVPALRGKAVTIYNVVDLQHFRPLREGFPNNGAPKVFRFVVASSYQRKKNMGGLIGAVELHNRISPLCVAEVDWYGDIPSDRAAYEEAVQKIIVSGLKGRFRLHPATNDISNEYGNAHAVILPSFYEGLPNAVCEAMACGKPILMSGVCDAANLVKPGVNGFLFNPASQASIAESIAAFVALPADKRALFGDASREMAEIIFDVRVIADRYIAILEAAAKKERRKFDHWLAEIPETANATLNDFT